jgi:hypothetical protein
MRATKPAARPNLQLFAAALGVDGRQQLLVQILLSALLGLALPLGLALGLADSLRGG